MITSVEIHAPPEAVWKNVVTFPDLPPPSHWLFRTGIAYPVRARIEGSGAGAIRYCEFSTGAFVEPIDVWDPPSLLRFRVTGNPPPLKEWNPFGEVGAPHLENYFLSEQGQFRLVRLEDGNTRLEGTTWYRHQIFPSAFWKNYSSFIIHRIHEEVLAHIKRLSEESASPSI